MSEKDIIPVNCLYKEILKYMKKYVNINLLFILIKQGLITNQSNKLFYNLRSYNEELAINEIEKYLSECRYKSTGFREISAQLYYKFIDNDDKHLIKLIKRLFIIYKRFHTKLLQKMLYKWQIIALKLNYQIYDYDCDINNDIFSLNEYENELDEPQLENKPNLYLNNFNNNYKINQKSKISGKKSSKNKSNNKSAKKNSENKKIEKNNDNLLNAKKIKNFTSVNNKKNKPSLNLKNKNKILDDFFVEPSQDNINKLNKTQNIYNEKEEENEVNKINKINNNNKTFEEKLHNKTFELSNKIGPENNNSLDNLILEGNNNNNLNNNINNNLKDNNINNNIIYFNQNDIDISSHFNSNFDYDINKSKSVDRKKNISNFMPEKLKPWAYSYYRRDNNDDNDILFKLKKKRPIMNNTERQKLFNNLYNDSKKRKEKYKKLSMEKEAKFNSIYTFSPKTINNKLNEKYLKNLAESKFNTNTTAFFSNNSNLITTTNNNYSLLNNAKNETNRNNNTQLGVVVESDKSDFTLDFMTRLAEYEKIKKNNLEKIRNEVDVNIRGNNAIKNRNKYILNKIPNNHLLNKSQNYLETKQKNLEKIAQNMYEEQGITFHPKTNKSFNDKIKNDIIERNKEFIKDKQEKLEKYSNVKEKECTFMPKINYSSKKAILNNSKGVGQNSTLSKTEQNSDVSKRLFDYQNKYKEKLEDIRSKYKESYSFKPEISKNTESILNNKKKIMEQIKENENEIINNVKEGNNYEFLNNNNLSKNNNNINNNLLMKKMKLGELEEISKRISELSEENMMYTDDKVSSQKKNNKTAEIDNTKFINENNQIVYNDNSNLIESSNFQIKPTLKNYKNNLNIDNNINYRNNLLIKNQPINNNSEKIMELAKNLINEDLSMKQNTITNDMNYYNNMTKERTNDFGSLMMYNNNSASSNKNRKNNNNDSRIPFLKENNYPQEYDFDNKGSKRIMNLNYYDNLL